jgi:hypothetical protein
MYLSSYAELMLAPPPYIPTVYSKLIADGSIGVVDGESGPSSEEMEEWAKHAAVGYCGKVARCPIFGSFRGLFQPHV